MSADPAATAANAPTATAPIRVLIADDQEAVRRSVRRILEQQADIEVVGDAEDGLVALELATRLRPDVVLVDIRMPRMDGLELTRRLVRLPDSGVPAGLPARLSLGPGAGPGGAEADPWLPAPGDRRPAPDTGVPVPDATGTQSDRARPVPAEPPPVRVVVLTTFDLDEYVYPALQYGACGFLLKRSGPALLVEAVRAAASGESLISPSVTVRLLRRVTAAPQPVAAAPASRWGRRPSPKPAAVSGAASSSRRLVVELTEREVEIAGQVAAGRTNADIAGELFISPGTVKTHVASIQRKLGVQNRVGIAMHAWEMGYPRPES
ncbi:response regulator [Kitasatospora sp. NPDC054939]